MPVSADACSATVDIYLFRPNRRTVFGVSGVAGRIVAQYNALLDVAGMVRGGPPTVDQSGGDGARGTAVPEWEQSVHITENVTHAPDVRNGNAAYAPVGLVVERVGSWGAVSMTHTGIRERGQEGRSPPHEEGSSRRGGLTKGGPHEEGGLETGSVEERIKCGRSRQEGCRAWQEQVWEEQVGRLSCASQRRGRGGRRQREAMTHMGKMGEGEGSSRRGRTPHEGYGGGLLTKREDWRQDCLS